MESEVQGRLNCKNHLKAKTEFLQRATVKDASVAEK